MEKKRPHRILFAEDNAGDVMLVEEALKRRSIQCQVTVYPDAQIAILAAQRCGVDGRAVPDLMLLDLNLPWGHGCDVLEAAARNPALNSVRKVILSSFLGPSGDSERARRWGATRFIVKPSSFERFLEDVGQQLADLLEPPDGSQGLASGVTR